MTERLEIELRGEIPPYMQVAEWLRARINAGVSAAGEVIPSEKELMDASDLARITVRKAIRVLREEGLIYTIPHRGSYVARR